MKIKGELFSWTYDNDRMVSELPAFDIIQSFSTFKREREQDAIILKMAKLHGSLMWTGT